MDSSQNALRVLLVAYKIRRDSGSEDGSGYHIATELIRRGYVVTLISRRNNVELLRADPAFAGVELVGVDVHRALGWFKRGGRGIIAYYYLWQLTVGRVVRQLSRSQSFDVIHQLNFHADWAPHFLPKREGIVWGPIAHHRMAPSSYFDHDDIRGRAKELLRAAVKRGFWRFDPALRSAIRRTDVILYANDDIAAPFRRGARSIVVRPYAGSFYSGPPDSPSGGEVFRVLFVGRLVPLKGVRPALQAFHEFARHVERGTVEFLVVGDGPLETAVQRAAAETPGVRHVPWVSQDELASVYASASIFLFPSVEAQGLVIAEALSFGLPVVGTRATGPAYLAGAAGRFVPLGGNVVSGLAEALRELYELWLAGGLGNLAIEARQRYETVLDWQTCCDAIVECYHSTVERHS